MKLTCITIRLQVNLHQKRYLLHHLYTTRALYLHVCKRVYKAQAQQRIQTQELYGMCKEYDGAYMRMMEDVEIQALVHAIATYQQRLFLHKTQSLPTYYACIITNQQLVWRQVSLSTLFPHPQVIQPRNIIYARLYEDHHQLYLGVYVKKRK